MTTQAERLMTAEEFAALGDIGRADLIRGRVVFLTSPKPKHGRIVMNLAVAIANYVKANKLGEVYAAETGFLVEQNPDSVRAPDMAFVRTELALDHDEDEYYPHSPDLAVEVLSPSDRPGSTGEKIRLWLDAGGRSVWVIDPANLSATIFRNDGSEQHVPPGGELRDESVLPGFSMALRAVFQR